MHIYFSGIGGTAIGPLAMIARQAGYKVSGSDKQDSQYVKYLHSHGIDDIQIGQSYDQIADLHKRSPIDWYVYSSAVIIENPEAPELKFCDDHKIKTSKRDELLNKIITDKKLKLVAIAGTHGKTTTTAMTVWLMKRLNIPISYAVGAKISYGEMGQYTPGSEYFIYEADEFDRNFLAFQPYTSLITGIAYDHQEIFPTLGDYQAAFRQFLNASEHKVVWKSDVKSVNLATDDKYQILEDNEPLLSRIKLVGAVNRRNAWQVINAVHKLLKVPLDDLINHINHFPGLSRRFERIADNLYSDYAHTPEKIKGCLQMAFEVSQNVIVVYEPLTDRRQHYIKDTYKDLFIGVKKLYWVPSYLAREDPSQSVLSPTDLISHMDNKDIAEPAALNDSLALKVQGHITSGDLVVCITGGGGGSLDEWIRQQFEK